MELGTNIKNRVLNLYTANGSTLKFLSIVLNVVSMNVLRHGKITTKELLFTTLHISVVLFSFAYSTLQLLQKDMENLAENLLVVTTSILTLSKVITLLLFTQDFKILSQTITKDLFVCTESNAKYIKMQQAADRKSKDFCLTLTAGMLFTIIGLCIYPMFTNQKHKLPMKSMGVLLPYDTDFAFVVNYAVQCWYQVFCIFVASSYDGFLTLLLIQGCTQIDIMRHKIKTNRIQFSEGSSSFEYSERLKSIHDHQIKISQFIRHMSKVFNFQITTQYVSSIVLICTSVYSAREGSLIVMLLFSLTAISEIFLFCWLGQLLKEKSNLVSTELYLTNWEDASKSQKRTVCLMLTCSKELLLLSTGFMDLDLRAFLLVLKTAYSFYTLLASVEN